MSTSIQPPQIPLRRPLGDITDNLLNQDSSPKRQRVVDRELMPPPSYRPSNQLQSTRQNAPVVIDDDIGYVSSAPVVLSPILPNAPEQFAAPAAPPNITVHSLNVSASRYPVNDERRRTLMVDFARAQQQLRYCFCHSCFEGSFNTPSWQIESGMRLCGRCKRESLNGGTPRFSIYNDMNPGVVPAYLPELSMIERMCLALVTPIVSVFRVGGGQWKGYTSHCINFFQDSSDIFNSIPRFPPEVAVVIARKKDVALQSSKDFRLNAHKLRLWIQYLRRYNKWYRHIGVSDVALSLLRTQEGGEIQRLFEIDDDSVEDIGAFNEGPIPGDATIIDDDVTHTGVFRSTVNIDEHSALGRLLNLRSATQYTQSALSSLSSVPTPAVDYPTISDEAVNEYTTDGYIARAFPCLFPVGRADLRDESSRKMPIKEGEYFTHLMRYYDGRFGKDPRFIHFALNAKLRWALNRAAGVFVMKKQMAKVTVGEIRQQAENSSINLGRSIARWSSNIPGLAPYWYREKRELISICKVFCPICTTVFDAL